MCIWNNIGYVAVLSVLDIIFVSLQIPSDTLNNDVPELMTLTLAGNPIGKEMALDIIELLQRFSKNPLYEIKKITKWAKNCQKIRQNFIFAKRA